MLKSYFTVQLYLNFKHNWKKKNACTHIVPIQMLSKYLAFLKVTSEMDFPRDLIATIKL